MTTTTKGFLYFAFNNSKINYVEMALASALALQHHSIVKDISIVTDSQSWNSLSASYKTLALNTFDRIIYEKPDWSIDSKNIRRFRDTQHHSERAEWHNTLRHRA